MIVHKCDWCGGEADLAGRHGALEVGRGRRALPSDATMPKFERAPLRTELCGACIDAACDGLRSRRSRPAAPPVALEQVIDTPLDELVDLEVFGMTPCEIDLNKFNVEMTGPSSFVFVCPEHGRKCRRPWEVPRYSSSMEKAWRVHREMCGRLFSSRRKYFDLLQGQARRDGVVPAWPDVLVVLRDVMPGAICRAALGTVSRG